MRCLSLAALLLASPVRADDAADLKKLVETPILSPRQTLTELQEYLDAKIPRVPEPSSAEAWTKETARLQKSVLDKVVFRGEAAKWRTATARVEYADSFTGDGYTVKKLRFEIIPGFWIPALLYVPDKLEGKVPVMLAVNGHDRAGKAAGYKQTRCINSPNAACSYSTSNGSAWGNSTCPRTSTVHAIKSTCAARRAGNRIRVIHGAGGSSFVSSSARFNPLSRSLSFAWR
jgi:hypothetical protein